MTSDYPVNFNPAFGYLIQNEGGLEDNAADTGGLTKYGLSKAQFPDIDIASLSIAQAQEIYFSNPPKGSPLPLWPPNYSLIRDPRVISKIFDMAVNMGPGTTHEIVQEALGLKNPTQVFGTITVGMVNRADPSALLLELAARAALHYSEIIVKNPADAIFALGWFRRAVKVPQ